MSYKYNNFVGCINSILVTKPSGKEYVNFNSVMNGGFNVGLNDEQCKSTPVTMTTTTVVSNRPPAWTTTSTTITTNTTTT